MIDDERKVGRSVQSYRGECPVVGVNDALKTSAVRILGITRLQVTKVKQTSSNVIFLSPFFRTRTLNYFWDSLTAQLCTIVYFEHNMVESKHVTVGSRMVMLQLGTRYYLRVHHHHQDPLNISSFFSISPCLVLLYLLNFFRVSFL